MSKQVNDRTIAILAYLTPIGFIIALVLNNNKPSNERKFNAFHLRQALGLILITIAFYIANEIFGAILMGISFGLLSITNIVSSLLSLAVLVYIILGIVNAINGREKELPYIGRYSSNLFSNTCQ